MGESQDHVSVRPPSSPSPSFVSSFSPLTALASPVQVRVLRLPVRRGRPDETVRTGALGAPDGGEGNRVTSVRPGGAGGSLFFFSIGGKKVSGVQSAEPVVISLFSCRPALNLMKFDGRSGQIHCWSGLNDPTPVIHGLCVLRLVCERRLDPGAADFNHFLSEVSMQ